MTTQTQKAWRIHSYGGPECVTLDDAPIPKPGPTQVLIAVSKAGINPLDWKLREGYVKDEFPLELPAIMGIDFSGTIVALGENATAFKVGDRVMTFTDKFGAFAEYNAVEESILSKVPPELDDASAASLPMPALTAWQSLHKAGKPLPGRKVLIHGASGIVGAFAIQFAKAAGMIVIGTASGKNRDYVLSLGADQFIDYKTEKFEDLVSDVDLILDYVLLGGAEGTTDRQWAVLKPNAAVVSVADPMVMSKAPAGVRAFFHVTDIDPTVLEVIGQQLATKQIKSKIGKIFEIEDLMKAMELNKAGGTTGRLLVDFKRK